MATAVYGGSPRHHNRSTSGGNSANHLSHGSVLQQSTPIMSGSLTNQSNNSIIFPPTSFLSSSSASPSSVAAGFSTTAADHHHYQQQHQQQHYSHHSLPHHSNHQYRGGGGSSHRHSKRKSAVEMLAESKPFYVKSDMVLDRQQQLYRGSVCPPPTSSCTYIKNDFKNYYRVIADVIHTPHRYDVTVSHKQYKWHQ